MPIKTAHLFPAFVLKYTGKEVKILEKHENKFQAYLNEASILLDFDLTTFDIKSNNFTDDEFLNQILSYIFSCSFSDILIKQNAKPSYISGFSMGIYAALYHAKAITFKTGILLIKEIFEQVKLLLKDQNYVMASVIGFSRADLKVLSKIQQSVEIVIQNGEYSFVISGKKTEVEILLGILTEEGAIHLSIFNVAYPYHSNILDCHSGAFEQIASRFEINSGKTELVSMIDQKIISSAEQLRNEIVRNVTQPLNFLQTITKLNLLETKQFIEVGADASLLKSSKFIEGEFDFKAIAKGKVL